MKKNILEIVVDRENEKGPVVFEEILGVLHKAYDDYQKKDSGWSFLSMGKKNKKRKAKINFSFEIVKMGNMIRFFIISPKKYTNFLKNQIYAHFNNVEIRGVADYLKNIPNDKILVGRVGLSQHFLFPIKTFSQDTIQGIKHSIDPYSSITGALSRADNNSLNAFQVHFSPIKNKSWKKGSKAVIEVLNSQHSGVVKRFLMNKDSLFIRLLYFPVVLLLRFIGLLFPFYKKQKKEEDEENKQKNNGEELQEKFREKLESNGFETQINIIYAAKNLGEGKMAIKELASTLGTYSRAGGNSFEIEDFSREREIISGIKKRNLLANGGYILNTSELSGLVHLPTNYVKTPQIHWIESKSFEPPSNLPLLVKKKEEITPIGITNFRGSNLDFGIDIEDRRRHMYIIGKTGMGKSTLLENMIIDDITKGRGVAVIDPHGDLAENVIGFIPKSRTNQTIIFDPSDTNAPIAFNMLESVSVDQRPLVASGLVGIFKKIFGNSWGPRLEHILRNTVLALIEYPNSTLISIPLMLTSDVFRTKVVSHITDPVVKNFWKQEFAKMNPKQRSEAAGPILNKVGQFLSSTILRNILGQSKNSFSIRWAMDNKKIIIINLSKGKIGEDASALLGSMMVTKFQMDAMSRADIPEKERVDFYLYVDEFQNFATDSFATILSEARKYKLNLVMANQYIDQMGDEVRGAIFGNVGSMISFQVGHQDAKILKDMYAGEITEKDLMNIKKYSIYTKLLIDGMPSTTFSASTFPPHQRKENIFKTRYKKILQVSREKYSKPRKLVEKRINNMLQDIEKQEQEWGKKKKGGKKKK